jgi:hypothetical protein
VEVAKYSEMAIHRRLTRHIAAIKMRVGISCTI